MTKKSIKILGWQISFGVVSLAILVIFLLALRILVMDWFSEYVIPILIVSGVLLVIFILAGTLTIKTIFKKIRL